MVLQISTLIDLLNSVVCAFLAVRIYHAYQQDPNSRTLRNFFYTFTLLTAAYVFLFVPRIFAAQQELLISITFALGNFAFLVASSFFGRIVLEFTRPKWIRKFLIIDYSLAIICLVWSLFDRAQPVVDTATGITQWNIPLGIGILGGVLLLLVLIPGAVLFLSRGFRTHDNHIVRVRSFTIGIGAILLVLTAITFYLANNETQAIIGDLISIGALLTIFMGVIYHRPRVIPAINSNSLATPK